MLETARHKGTRKCGGVSPRIVDLDTKWTLVSLLDWLLLPRKRERWAMSLGGSQQSGHNEKVPAKSSGPPTNRYIG
jgi:hypothetical protein